MADDGGVPISALSMIVDGLKRLEESITRLSVDMHEQMGRLPNDYVPRREVERRLDEYAIDLGALDVRLTEKRATHDRDIKDLRECLKQIELDREQDEQERERQRKADLQRRETDRRWLIGTVIAVVGLLLTMIALVSSLMGG